MVEAAPGNLTTKVPQPLEGNAPRTGKVDAQLLCRLSEKI
jgi:hypothetical protein